MSWTDTMDAIETAVASASGIPVIWGFQDIDQPALPYAEISLTPLTVIGQDWLTVDYSVTRAAGKEIAQTVHGMREIGLEVSVFTEGTANAGDALDIGEKLRASLLLPSIRDPLAAVGVTPFDPGPVNYIPTIVSAGFRGRSHQTIRCYMPAPTVVEYVGYIATVNGTITPKTGAITHGPFAFSIGV